MWARIVPTNGKDIDSWEIFYQQHEVGHLSIKCMKLHFSQSNNTPLTSDFWIKELTTPSIQDAITAGEYDFSTYPKPIQTFFEALRINHTNDKLEFSYPLHEFEQFLKNAKEKTSASPSGRHYGHFKVIQHHLPQILKEILCLMVICMTHNVLLHQYYKTVTTLIAKETDQPKIHRL